MLVSTMIKTILKSIFLYSTSKIGPRPLWELEQTIIATETADICGKHVLSILS